MDITFRTRRLGRIFSSERLLRREYGDLMARTIRRSLNVLEGADNLTEVSVLPPFRRHLLSGDRAGQYAIDLVHPYRLVFEPSHEPIPLLEDGGIDAFRVTAIEIIEVVDYH